MRSATKILTLLTAAERRRAFLLLGLMVIGMALETAGIGVFIPAIALLTQSDLATRYPQLQPMLTELGNPSPVRLATYGMVALVFFYMIKVVFLGFLTWWQTKFAYDVQAQLSQRLFATYLRQPYSFHLQRNSAQLIRNAITEVNQFTASILSPGLLVITEGLVLVGIVSLLLFVEPLGAVIVVLVLGGASWGLYHSTRARIARWGLARQHHEGLRIQHLQQGLGGAKDVKLLGRESDFLAQYHIHNLQSARVGQLQMTLAQLPRLLLELLAVAGLTTLVLTMLVQGRDMVMIVPTLGLFAAAAFRLLPSVNRVLGAMQALRYGVPVVNVLHEELKLASPESTQAGTFTFVFRTGIQLSDVSYTYPAAPSPALSEVSIAIRHGESVGVIGRSGAGKSTLVDVVLGLLTPDAGQVRVDGQDIQRHLRAWQDQIGYVPQAVYLTDDTLRRNVAFGLPGEQIDEVAVRRAIRSAQLEEFVASLPDGLETVVGERGVRLSGGQRQRIGIARALYHDPRVLILDEATSSLDADTEEGIIEAVRALHGAKTIVIVSHRPSTVGHCDRLYRLERGRVLEERETPMSASAATKIQ